MVRNLPILVLFLGFLCAVAGLAQGASPGIGQLPPHLRFEEGKINLVVDYAAAESGGSVPIYVVNATSRSLHILRGHPIFRETRGDDGLWRRCDPVLPAWPGVGIHDDLEIQPSGFYKTERAQHSRKGERRPIRFREYTGEGPLAWISNEGFGVVDPEDVEACRFDAISVERGPFEDVARMARHEVPLFGEHGMLWKRAVLRVGLWKEEPRRIAVLKEAIVKAKAANQRDVYALALGGLCIPSPPEWTRESYWKFAMQEFQSGAPLASVAFDSLIYAPFFQERKRVLLDRVIADPNHPGLARAIQAYSEIVGEPAARKMAQRILRSSKYPDAAKAAAKAIVSR